MRRILHTGDQGGSQHKAAGTACEPALGRVMVADGGPGTRRAATMSGRWMRKVAARDVEEKKERKARMAKKERCVRAAAGRCFGRAW